MKTQTLKKTTRRIFLAAAVATSATLAASATTTTYCQVKNWEMAGLPSGEEGGVEITTTPQLAFPGVTVEQIQHCTFLTKLYGSNIDADYSTAWGTYPTTCDLNGDGHVDKLAFQFAMLDGAHTKVVILALTDGEGGVYVQWARKVWRLDANGVPSKQYYNMNASGVISAQNGSGSSDVYDGTYCASGIRIHGMRPSSTASESRLAFPGTTLEQLKGSTFMAGYRQGTWFSNVETNNMATYVTNWTDSESKLKKIVMQFNRTTPSGDANKSAVIVLEDGEDGVHAKQVLSVSGTGGKQAYSIDASGNVTLNNGTSQNDKGNMVYPVHELYVQYAPLVKKTPNKIKVFSDPSKTLALDDIQNGDFTARMCGGWVDASFRETHNTGYNKKVYTDETSGSVTNIIVEFQVRDGSAKCLVVAFTNGADGIYAEAINARYAAEAIGYEFRDYDGTLYGAQNNRSGEIVAETLTDGGYGAFDLRVTAPTVHKWTLDATKDWSTLSGGETVEADEVVKITVNDPAAVLTVDADVSVGKIEFVGGNCAQLIVASGQTLTAEDITGVTDILNNGTLVKTGSGTVAWPFNRDSAGETVVSNGTLKVASQTGSGTSHVVRVKDGAVFDVNGVQNIHVAVRLEEGATYTNGKVYNSYLYNAKLPVKVVLEGDAAAMAACAFGLNGPSHTSQLDLGTHSLTIDGSADFMLYDTAVTGSGTVVVSNKGLVSFGTSGGDAWTLDVRSGATLSVNGTGLTMKDFVNGGSCSGTAKLTVKGMLTPGSAAIANLTLAAGATVKATGTAQVVSTTFAASGTITVDASEITKAQLDAGDVAVMTVPAAFNPSGITWNVSGAPVADARTKWRTDEGGATKTLYVGKPTGLMVIIR